MTVVAIIVENTDHARKKTSSCLVKLPLAFLINAQWLTEIAELILRFQQIWRNCNLVKNKPRYKKHIYEFFASVNCLLCLGLKVNFVWDCEFGFTLVLEELVISFT